MLIEFIDFINHFDYNKRLNIYNIALNYHNYNNIIAFKNVIFKDRIINNFNIDNKYYMLEDLVINAYYDFGYYYKYIENVDEYNIFLKLIMDTINNYTKSGKDVI